MKEERSDNLFVKLRNVKKKWCGGYSYSLHSTKSHDKLWPDGSHDLYADFTFIMLLNFYYIRHSDELHGVLCKLTS